MEGPLLRKHEDGQRSLRPSEYLGPSTKATVIANVAPSIDRNEMRLRERRFDSPHMMMVRWNMRTA